jgi:diguanylate cyclase (GGDEF)-like protein
MGDLNGLKTINDTYGHNEGDTLLKSTSQIMTMFLPDGGHLARIGGDEFVMLLPSFSASQVEVLINSIQNYMANIPDSIVKPSIALGSATKNKPHENINTLINEADVKMYNDKHGTRR